LVNSRRTPSLVRYPLAPLLRPYQLPVRSSTATFSQYPTKWRTLQTTEHRDRIICTCVSNSEDVYFKSQPRSSNYI
jgi:hypothetical protein